MSEDIKKEPFYVYDIVTNTTPQLIFYYCCNMKMNNILAFHGTKIGNAIPTLAHRHYFPCRLFNNE